MRSHDLACDTSFLPQVQRNNNDADGGTPLSYAATRPPACRHLREGPASSARMVANCSANASVELRINFRLLPAVGATRSGSRPA
jgi:hypothetical protein